MKKLVLIIGALVLAQGSAFAANYKVDPEHSSVSFKIRHLVSKVQGNFNDFSGSFVYEPGSPDIWEVEAVIQAASIDTNVAERDKHLKSADFFDVEKFPELTFRSTKVTDAITDSAKLHGFLTIRGVEREVVFDLEILGQAEDGWGNKFASFSATTTINRKDFGLTWNKTLEAGNVLVGEEVKITLDIAGMLQE